MLSVARYFSYHGLSVDDVRRMVRPLRDGESLLLVGSVAEGLSNAGSDLDLLLLGAEASDEPDWRSKIMRSMPAAFDVNLEILTPTEIDALGHRFKRSLNCAGSAMPESGPTAIRFIGPDDLRLLHRLYTGLPVSESGNRLAELRERYALHRLADVCLLQQAACHLRLRADAEQAVLDGREHDTAVLMTQIAAQHLLGCVLASAGETNMTPKWSLRLMHDHAHALQHLDLDAIRSLVLNPSGASTHGTLDRLTAVSSRTLAALVAAAERSGSPVANAIRALVESQPGRQPVEA